jgi:tRNA-specific 2-thiouridylase
MKKVLVGMSGGVDSSVTALLLKQEGYEVVGTTFKLFEENDLLETGKSGCCSIESVDDARAVCESIGIPHYVLNYKNLFQKQVIDYFASSYIAGKTPNPCISCNRYIKFDAFIIKALSMGFDYIATGHYAQIDYNCVKKEYELKKAAYMDKDQSYVLYHQTQESLSRILLPVGKYSKTEIRKIAEENNLPVFNKPDSQDVCFIPDGDYASFINKYLNTPVSRGNFVDMSGNIIGKHNGYYKYTVGQRRGLGIGFGERRYVIKTDPITNTVVLGDNEDLYSSIAYISDMNIIQKDELKLPLACAAKVRYSQPEQKALLEYIDGKRFKLTFEKPQRAVAKGQALVLYDDNIVIGGGEIE